MSQPEPNVVGFLWVLRFPLGTTVSSHGEKNLFEEFVHYHDHLTGTACIYC